MEEQRISFNIAKLAKKKRVTFYCNKAYVETAEHTIEDHHTGNEHIINYKAPRIISNNHGYLDEHDIFICNAPTQSSLQKWLREKYGIHIEIEINSLNEYESCVMDIKSFSPYHLGIGYPFFEEALEAGLVKALNLIKT